MKGSFWSGRTVLVTGATGLVGGWLLKRLLHSGANVVVLVRTQASKSFAAHEHLLNDCSVVEGLFSDAALLQAVFSSYSPQTVFHLAAQTQVGAAWNDPVGTFETNIRGTWGLLETCRKTQQAQVILASSDKAYGTSNNLPRRETDRLEARFPYDVSKSCADLIAQMYAQAYNLPVCIARCGNIFGGGDFNFARIIPGLIRDTLQNKPFVIRGDGKSARDFLYVEDAADAYLKAAECLDRSPSLAGEAFNFSLGVRISVLELVEMVLSIMDRTDLVPILQNEPGREVKESYMVTEKALKMLGWSPRVGLEEGLKRTVSWYTEYFSKASNRPSSDLHTAARR
jgi:CDP-glucose 4,6-dehydratase